MRTRDRMALNLTPLCLRLPLALIFLWAGLSKVITTFEVTPQQITVLQAHSVSIPNAPPPPSPPNDQPTDQPTDTPDAGAADAPADTLPEDPAPDPDPTSIAPTEPLPDPVPSDDEPAPANPDAQPQRSAQAPLSAHITLVQDGAPPDKPEPVTARSVYQLVLLMDQAANPDSRDDGSAKPAIWPKALASKRWPVFLAWGAALTEIFAGFFLLIGLITRLSALSLAGVMLVAIWLTTIGAAIQKGDAFLGFLPNNPFLSFAWQEPLFQLIVLMSCLALFFAGPGTLALDRAIFAPSSADDWDDDDDDDDARDRSSFDRAP